MNLKHKNEDGRSMVEMLGTLAIIGVLSIGGIAGYSYGMNKYKANTIIQDIMLRATDAIAQYDATGDANLSEWPTTTAGKYTIGLEEDTIGIQVDGLPEQLCEMVYNAIKDKADVKFNGTISDESTPVDCSNTNSMVFYVDNTIDIARGEQTTPPTECTTHDDCKAEGVCMGCIIEDGKETGRCEYACQELEYLESDGGQYIDTGIRPTNNTRVAGKVLFKEWLGSANYVFGVYGDSKNFGFNVGSARTYFNVPWYNNSGLRVSVTPSFNTIFNFDISKDGMITNGQLFTDPLLESTFQADRTMFIGWCNGTTANKMKGEIYFLKIWDSGTLLRNFTPVLDPEGTPAMLDKVEEKLYYNQGSGQFKYAK